VSDDNDNKVIPFPNPHKGLPPDSMEVRYNILEMRSVHIEESVEAVFEILFDNLRMAGFEFDDEGIYGKDIALIIESIKSICLKRYDEAHFLQSVAERSFDITDGEIGFSKELVDAVLNHKG
jgi:hypothetical protein